LKIIEIEKKGKSSENGKRAANPFGPRPEAA
jgi:hypothetical protein